MQGRPKSQGVWWLVCLLFLSLQVQAGEVLAGSGPSRDIAEQDRALEQVREELDTVERRWYGLMRIRWHDLQGVSAGLGAMFVKQSKNIDCSTGCAIRGWHFSVEPGLNGIQGGVGWGKLVGETGRTNRLMHTVHFGWSVRGVVMRTWGHNVLFPESQTLAGIEASVSIIRLNFSLSALRSLYSGPGDQYTQDWVISTGFGWGF